MLNSTDGRIDVSDLIRQVEIENLGSCRLSQSEYMNLCSGTISEQHDVLSAEEELEETMITSLVQPEEVDSIINAIGSRSSAGRVRRPPAWMLDRDTVLDFQFD